MQKKFRYKYVLLVSLIVILFLTGISQVTTWKAIPVIILILSGAIFLIWVNSLFSWGEKVKKEPIRRVRPYISWFIECYGSGLVLFSFIYYAASKLGHEIKPVKSPVDYLYFSVTTATTLGYGDITPSDGFTKILSIIEVSFGVVFIAAVLAVVLALQKNHPQSNQ